MKNIGFDQSTVMTEFANIMHREELVKTAENKKLTELWDKILNSKYKGHLDHPKVKASKSADELVYKIEEYFYTDTFGNVKDVPQDLADIMKPYKAVSGSFNRENEPNADDAAVKTAASPPTDRPEVKRWAQVKEMLFGYFKSLLEKLPKLLTAAELEVVRNKTKEITARVSKTQPFEKEDADNVVYKEILPLFTQKPEAQKLAEQLYKMHSFSTTKITAAVKTAADSKIYDVSGETGENLIDSAHPGKMKTELTNNKTDGGLVETIFEQQEADIKIVEKKPKGTYAELMKLHKKLSAMGVKELSDLEADIKKVATEGSVLLYTLSELANELDARGDFEAANKIDAMIKEAGENKKSDAKKSISKRATEPMTPYSAEVDKAIKDWTNSKPQSSPAPQGPYYPVDSSGKPIIPNKDGIAEKKELTPKEKVIALQKWYNKTMGSKILKEDGVIDEPTNAQIKLFKLQGWKKYSDSVKNFATKYQGSKQDLTPEQAKQQAGEIGKDVASGMQIGK